MNCMIQEQQPCEQQYTALFASYCCNVYYGHYHLILAETDVIKLSQRILVYSQLLLAGCIAIIS